MSIFSRQFIFLIPVVVICTLPACKHADYSKQIHDLDSLHHALTDASERYATLDVADLGAKVDSVNRHLDYIQKNYVGYQREDMGLALSHYRKVKKMIPDIASAHDRIQSEIQLTLQQVQALSQALKDGATHDSAGNKMTEDYLDKACVTETKKASELVKQLKELLVRAPKADSIYQVHYPRVRFWVDSIPPVAPLNLPVPRK